MKKKSENISLLRFIFYGINGLFGIGIIASLGRIYAQTGNYMYLLAVTGCAICFGVGVIYAYLSNSLDNAKGSIYSYMKKAFGYRAGFFFNWCQYIVSPTVLAAETMAVILAFQETSFYSKYFYLIVGLSGLLFIVQSALLVFGYKSTKIVVIVLTTVVMISIGFYVFSAFGFIGKGGFFQKISSNPSGSDVHYSLSGFITSFFAFFFALGGIEYLAASSDELKDKKGTIIKGLVIVMLILLVGYLLMAVIVKGGVGSHYLANSSTLEGNPFNDYWVLLFGSVGGTVVILVYASIKILGEMNARLAIGWLAARVIEPLADDGFMPQSWAKRNKHHQLSIAITWHSIISGVFIIALFIPLLMYGRGSGLNTVLAPLQINTVLEFMQYTGTAVCGIVLIRRNMIRKNIGVYALCYIMSGLLPALLALWLYSTIVQGLGLETGSKPDPTQWISLGASVAAIVISIPIYYLGKFAKWHDKGWKSHHHLLAVHTNEKAEFTHMYEK